MENILVITPVKQIKNFKKNISKIGKVKYLDDPNEKEVLKIIKDYTIIFANPNKSKIFIGKKIIDHSPNLKVICTASTGTNHIDLNYAKNNNIKVISLTKDFKTINKISSTAELALTLTLSCIRNLIPAYLSVLNNKWDYTEFIGKQMNMVNIGVIGYGRLGKIYTKLCKSFNSTIYVYDPNVQVKDTKINQLNSLKKICQHSDIISLHIHASEKNKNLINLNLLNLMKSDVIIINTSRGEIINEHDLINFLKKNPNAKYGTDVISREITHKKSSPILKYAKNNHQILITPHIGGMTSHAQEIAYNGAVSLLKQYLVKE